MPAVSKSHREQLAIPITMEEEMVLDEPESGEPLGMEKPQNSAEGDIGDESGQVIHSLLNTA